MRHVVSAYYILLCGYSLAVFIFVVEKIPLFPPERGVDKPRAIRQVFRRH